MKKVIKYSEKYSKCNYYSNGITSNSVTAIVWIQAGWPGPVPQNINAYLEKLMVRNSSVTLTHVQIQFLNEIMISYGSVILTQVWFGFFFNI